MLHKSKYKLTELCAQYHNKHRYKRKHHFYVSSENKTIYSLQQNIRISILVEQKNLTLHNVENANFIILLINIIYQYEQFNYKRFLIYVQSLALVIIMHFVLAENSQKACPSCYAGSCIYSQPRVVEFMMFLIDDNVISMHHRILAIYLYFARWSSNCPYL